jgi:hypothetical protein
MSAALFHDLKDREVVLVNTDGTILVKGEGVGNPGAPQPLIKLKMFITANGTPKYERIDVRPDQSQERPTAATGAARWAGTDQGIDGRVIS